MDELNDLIICPACDSAQDESECFLGQLGWLTHYRCRYCGATFSSPSDEGDDQLSEQASYFEDHRDQGGEA